MRKTSLGLNPEFTTQWSNNDMQKISVLNNDPSSSLSGLSTNMMEDVDFFRVSDPLTNNADPIPTAFTHESDEDSISPTSIRGQDSLASTQQTYQHDPLPYHHDEGELELTTFSDHEPLFGLSGALDIHRHQQYQQQQQQQQPQSSSTLSSSPLPPLSPHPSASSVHSPVHFCLFIIFIFPRD
jgi:hypothetical protein